MRRVWAKVIVLMETGTNLSFKDQVGHILEVLNLVVISSNLSVI